MTHCFAAWNRRWRRKSRVEKLSVLLLAVGFLFIMYYIVVNWVPKWYRQLTYRENLDMTVTGEAYAPLPVYTDADNYYRFTYPTDALFETDERQAYASGEMLLRIPRLALEVGVESGTGAASLRKGPGLYNCSALPSYGNPNVCIAAHRGVFGAEFYYIDRITVGDLIYLEYDNYLFTYEYVATTVVPAEDWSEMYCTDYSAVTLTSCQLTNSTERICVRGKLVSIVPLEGAGIIAASDLTNSTG